MCKLFTILALIITTNVTTAQKAFFVKPYAGIGIAGVKQVHFNGPYNTDNNTGYTAGVNVGRSFNHLRVSIGGGYLSTSNILKPDLTFEHQFNPGTGKPYETINVTYRYSHIIMPITVAYAIKLHKKLSIVPELAIVPAYNAGGTIKKENTVTEKTVREPFKTMNQYNRISLFGTGGVNIEYNINKYMGITLGPAYTHMLSNFYKVPDNALFKATRHHYALTANAGVVLKL